MGEASRFLRVSVTVFKVLAWISLIIQVALGILLLVSGGPAVPVGGFEVPARVVGVLNCLAGAIYFFLFMFAANLVRVLLDIRQRQGS